MWKLWTGLIFEVRLLWRCLTYDPKTQQNAPHFIYLGKLTSKYRVPQEDWGRCSTVHTNTATVAWVQSRSPNIWEHFPNPSTHQDGQEGLWKPGLLGPPPELLNQEVWGGGQEFAFLTSSRLVLILLGRIFITTLPAYIVRLFRTWPQVSRSHFFATVRFPIMHLPSPKDGDFFSMCPEHKWVSSIYLFILFPPPSKSFKD